jgi:preprotein translocase subunit YajC
MHIALEMEIAISVADIIELSVKSSKESTEPVSLLKTGNKVVEVGWVHSKVEDEEGTTVGSKLSTNT